MSKYFYFVDYNGDYVVCRRVGNTGLVIERLPVEELALELIGCLEEKAA